MGDAYSVRIAKAEHVFSAAHFITFGGHCERLHGHNYRVAVEIDGPLDSDQLVVDFLAVREELRRIISQLDHVMLLPTLHPQLAVHEVGDEVQVYFENRRWLFPREDCKLLPLTNTTAELMARYIGLELRSGLADRCHFEPVRLQVELDECDGQLGIWQWTSGSR